jgi:hypothetical protein
MVTLLEQPEMLRSRHVPLLNRLRAVVLLSGSVRPRRLIRDVGRPAFELPLESGLTILDHWRLEVAGLGRAIGSYDLCLRVLVECNSPGPTRPPSVLSGLAPVQIEHDPTAFRGTGGVLRDLAAECRPDDVLLVGNAAQVLIQPLADLAVTLADTGGDVAVVSDPDGTPSGLMLLRCAALEDIPSSGFVDMKEQALPEIAQTHRVTVAELPAPAGMPVRTLEEYIQALRRHHREKSGNRADPNPFAENIESSFSIVESGAKVDPSARLYDSVALAGSTIEANATAVQSVVCHGSILRRRVMAVDELVTGDQRRERRD